MRATRSAKTTTPSKSTPANTASRRSTRLSDIQVSQAATRPLPEQIAASSPSPPLKSPCLRCPLENHEKALASICINCGVFFSVSSKKKKSPVKPIEGLLIKGRGLFEIFEELGENGDSYLGPRTEIICNTCCNYLYTEKHQYFKSRTVNLSLLDVEECIFCEIFEDKSSFAEIQSKKMSAVESKSSSKPRVQNEFLPHSFYYWRHVCRDCFVEFEQGKRHVCSKKKKIENILNYLTQTEQQTLAKRILHNHFNRSGSFKIYGVGRPMRIANLSYHKTHVEYSVEDVISLEKKFKISQRMTIGILSFIRDHGRNQRVVHHMASRKMVSAEIEARVGELFACWEGVLNIGSDATPKYDPIKIFYCNDIGRLVQRVLKFRKKADIPIAAKLGCDHGQSKLLVTLNLNFSNSVDEILLVACSLQAKENKSCLRYFILVCSFDHNA